MASKQALQSKRRTAVRSKAKRKRVKKPSEGPLSRKALKALIALSPPPPEFFEGKDETAPFDVRKE
jgi:hypothetical protein